MALFINSLTSVHKTESTRGVWKWFAMYESKQTDFFFWSDVCVIVSVFKHLREYLAYLGREFYIV